uniref:Testis cDNA, clone: QtsA-14464, similar to human demidefensin 3 (LOC392182) n=1 Tax=Macaca fascicularis TaxID=9541 RepID=Q4R7S7_MACFA|nr:unnamed protein product [Macaca fascicularis]
MSHSLIICSRLLLGGSFIRSCLTCLCLSMQGHQEKHGGEEGEGPHGWSDLEEGEQERTSRERLVSLDFYVCREKAQRQEILNLVRERSCAFRWRLCGIPLVSMSLFSSFALLAFTLV